MPSRVSERPRFSYLIDESSLRFRRSKYPVRVFSLRGLGINQRRFLRELAPTFSMLSWDEYDVKRVQVVYLKRRFPRQRRRLDEFLVEYYAGRATLQAVGDLIVKLPLPQRWELESISPRRKRSIAKFTLERAALSAGWRATRLPAQAFTQQAGSEAGDYRSLVRVFNEASELTTSHPDFQALLLRLAELVGEVRPGSRKLAMTMHQVSIFAEAGEEGDNSPEGVHQDGADFIVSALVVERDGVIGAESIVYGADKKTEILRHTLQPGEGLFQADKNTSLWHDVTLIQDDPATPPTYGKRSIFGFDINVVE